MRLVLVQGFPCDLENMIPADWLKLARLLAKYDLQVNRRHPTAKLYRNLLHEQRGKQSKRSLAALWEKYISEELDELEQSVKENDPDAIDFINEYISDTLHDVKRDLFHQHCDCGLEFYVIGIPISTITDREPNSLWKYSSYWYHLTCKLVDKQAVVYNKTMKCLNQSMSVHKNADIFQSIKLELDDLLKKYATGVENVYIVPEGF